MTNKKPTASTPNSQSTFGAQVSTSFNNFRKFTNEKPTLVRRRANEYYEIQVIIDSHPPMRELILATCKAEALDKARAKYQYVRAEIELVPSEAEKLKLARSTNRPKRKTRRKKDAVNASPKGDDAVGVSTTQDQTQA